MANSNNEDILNSINNKLSVMINLLMRKEEMSAMEKVAFMDSLNIPNKDAALILGMGQSHYDSAKSKIKSKNNKKQTLNNVNLGEPQNGKGTKQGNSEPTA